MNEVLAWLEGSALGHAIRNANLWTYSLINLTHIVGVSSLFGSILVLDLRLLGFGKNVPLGPLSRAVTPIALTGFIVAASSGICMLATNGTDYAGNPFLLIKFSAVGLGLVNVALLNRLPAWKARDTEALTAVGRRQLAIAGGLSLVCWVTAISAGRLIAYW